MTVEQQQPTSKEIIENQFLDKNEKYIQHRFFCQDSHLILLRGYVFLLDDGCLGQISIKVRGHSKIRFKF